MNQHNQLPNDFPPGSVGTPSVAIDWYRAAPWWRAVSPVLNLSWRASHILLCCAGIVLARVCFAALFWVFQPEVPETAMHAYLEPNFLNLSPIGGSDPSAAPYFLSVWGYYLAPLNTWLNQPTLRLTAAALAYVACLIAIWGFIGGCLTRRTVVECGTSSTMPWMETFQIVFKRWQSIAWSLAMPACALVIVMLFPFLVGVISRLPWVGGAIAWVLLIPVMFAVLGVAWVCAITLLGFPFSVCSIVTERRADAFDGVSRSAAYVFQRPLLFLLLIAGFHLLSIGAGQIFGSIIWVGKSLLIAGLDMGASSEMVASQSYVLNGVPNLILAGFAVSFFWSAAASIYLILRREVDRTEYDHFDPVTSDSESRSKVNDSAMEIGSASSVPNSDQSTDVG